MTKEMMDDDDEVDGFRMDFSTWSDPSGTWLHTHQFTVKSQPGTCPYCFRKTDGDMELDRIIIRWHPGGDHE